jgi:hypothetical protein
MWSWFIAMWTVFLIRFFLDYYDDFFVVVYLETPGDRLFKLERHSVHSNVIKRYLYFLPYNLK